MATLKTIFRCEAAGRENNEDNGQIFRLGADKGDLLLVCDGMGGMEAGEVASALAVATIEEWFSPERIAASVLANPVNYMLKAIVGADTNIKDYTKKDPKTEGMGSTIVMAWLIGQKMYVAWCGDSRAYRYNPKLGLERLSRDHSLVQTWVDAGQITEDQAFDHPQSNIITRSLGDPNGVAMPEAAEYDLYDGDVILLCSDGLCGTLRDSEIETILTQSDDLSKNCDQLWQADEAAGWHDNVTTAMAQVISGGAILTMVEPEPMDNGIEVMPEPVSNGPSFESSSEPYQPAGAERKGSFVITTKHKTILSIGVIVLVLLAVLAALRNWRKEQPDPIMDSVPSVTIHKVDTTTQTKPSETDSKDNIKPEVSDEQPQQETTNETSNTKPEQSRPPKVDNNNQKKEDKTSNEEKKEESKEPKKGTTLNIGNISKVGSASASSPENQDKQKNQPESQDTKDKQ